MVADEQPEIRVITDLLPLWAAKGERPFSKMDAPRPWSVFGPDRIVDYIRSACSGHEGEPTLHFFSAERPVRDVERIRREIKLSQWSCLDELDQVLRRIGFIGTVRVTQLHRLDKQIEEVVTECLKLLDTRRPGFEETEPVHQADIINRFFHRHGGVNAYFSMRDSDRAIAFHRDPGDVFAFQAQGGKLWELGSNTTLYGGSYHDTDERGSIEVATLRDQILFLPRGIRHRAKAVEGMMSLHYVLMVDTAPEYWVLAGLAETLKDLPLFNCARMA